MTGTSAAAEYRPASAATAFLRRVGLFTFGIAKRAVAARARAQTLRILSGLDDYELKDIGLHRGQIDAIEGDPRYTPRFPGF
jgi:uncharacterized protein YjiS (DUF1127 family)